MTGVATGIGPLSSAVPHLSAGNVPLRVLRRTALWLLVLAFFSGDAWAWGRLFDWLPLRVAADVLILLALAAWLIPKVKGGNALPSSPLDLPLIGLSLIAVLSAITAREPAAAAEPLIQLVLMVLWFKAASEAQETWAPGNRLLVYLLVASSGLSLQVLLDFLHWYAGTPWIAPLEVSWLEVGAGVWPPAFPRVGLVTGPVVISGYLAALVPPAVGWSMSAPRPYIRWLLMGWLLLTMLALFLTASRSGWLAAAAGCLTLLALMVRPRWREGGSSPFPQRGLTAAALGAAAAVLVLVTLSTTLSARSSSTLQRLYIWGEGVRVWLQQPLSGIGPGNYVLAQLSVRPDAVLEDVYSHAHNLPLQVLVVLGPLGLAAAGWLGWSGLKQASSLWRATGPQERPLQAGYLGGLVSVLAYGLTDVPTHSFMLWATGAALAALALAPASPAGEAMSAAARHRAGLAALLAALAVALGVLEGDHMPAFQAAQLAREERWGEASGLLQRAAPASPAGHYYLLQAGLLEGYVDHWEDAYSAYRATEGGPTSAQAQASAAYVASQVGDYPRAAAWARQAARMLPRDPRYPLLLGWLEEGMGRLQEAVQAYGVALALRPEWLTSSYWTVDSQRAAQWDAIVAAALAWADAEGDLPDLEREVLKGQLLVRLGRSHEASRTLTAALAQAQGRDLGSVAEEIGGLLQGQGRSIARREYALFDPASSQAAAHYYLGVVALQEGDRVGAASAFHRAVAAGPANPLGYLGLSVRSLEQDDLPGALRNGRTALVYGGGRPAAAALGRALLRAGQPGAAARYLELASEERRTYTMAFGLKVYQRREVLPNVLPQVPDLAPDGDIAAVLRDLAQAYGAMGDAQSRLRTEQRLAQMRLPDPRP